MKSFVTLTLVLALGAGIAPAAAQESPHVTLSLAQALDLAQRNNLDYQVAQAEVSAAQARLMQAASALAPALGLSYAYQHAQSAQTITLPLPNGRGGVANQTLTLSSTDTNVTNAVLQYVLFNGGANAAALGAASAGFSAAQSQRTAVHNTVLRDATAAYFALVQAQRAAAIADQAVDVALADVKTAEQLFAAGSAAKADVLRQHVSLADAQTRRISAHNAVALANAALANVLNIDLGSLVDPNEPLEVDLPQSDLQSALRAAQSKRPELAAAENAVAIADRSVTIARSGSLPFLALGAQETYQRPKSTGIPQPQLVATLSATWRLFDGGLTRGKMSEARAQVEKAKLNLAQLHNGVDLEVRQAYFNYVSARAQIETARAAVASASESLRLSRLRYQNGAGTSLELADALLSDTSARTQLVNALANLRTSYAALQRAQGAA